MKKTTIFFLMFLFNLQSAYAFGPAIRAVLSASGPRNDFSADSNCVALYNMESGALTTDSKSTNTLSDINGVGTDTTNFVQGAASAYFQKANTEALSITDANLAAGFPLKDGDTTKDFSVVAAIRLASAPVDTEDYVYFAKTSWDTTSLRSMALGTINESAAVKVYIYRAHAADGSNEYVKHASGLSNDTWYVVGCTYLHSTAAYAIRIREPVTGTTIGTDLTGTFSNAGFNVSTGIMAIGAVHASAATYYSAFDGEIDHVSVWRDVLTSDEITNIAKGIFR